MSFKCFSELAAPLKHLCNSRHFKRVHNRTHLSTLSYLVALSHKDKRKSKATLWRLSSRIFSDTVTRRESHKRSLLEKLALHRGLYLGLFMEKLNERKKCGRQSGQATWKTTAFLKDVFVLNRDGLRHLQTLQLLVAPSRPERKCW